MSYAAVIDVQAINSRRANYSGSTHPSKNEVEKFITDIAAEIDSVLLGKGIAVPVTTPAAFLTFLKRTNALGAATQAELSARPERRGSDQPASAAASIHKRYQANLDRIADGSAIPSTLAVTDEVFAATVRTDETEAAALGPYVKIDQVF